MEETKVNSFFGNGANRQAHAQGCYDFSAIPRQSRNINTAFNVQGNCLRRRSCASASDLVRT